MFEFLNFGKRKREQVFSTLLKDAYYNHYDEILTNNDVYFEAAYKFAEEHSEKIPYKSDSNTIVFRYTINDELLSVYFSKSFSGKLIYSVKRISEVENLFDENTKQENSKNNKTFTEEQILGTAYNMIREVIEEANIEPIANNAPFLNWEKTVNLLKKDNGEAFIKLEDGTGYGMNFGGDKIIFIVKEKEGYPIFTNQKFYEKYYNDILDNAREQDIEAFSDEYSNDEIFSVIDQLNKAELDYNDIEDVSIDTTLSNYYLKFSMYNEENFSLNFHNKNRTNIALDLIKFKLTQTIEKDYLSVFDLEFDLDFELEDYEKLSFANFIVRYNLKEDELNALWKWQEQNESKKLRDRIVDFKNCNLSFKNIGNEKIAFIYND